MMAGVSSESRSTSYGSTDETATRLSQSEAESSSDEGLLDDVEDLFDDVKELVLGMFKCSKILIVAFWFVGFLAFVSMVMGALTHVGPKGLFFWIILISNFVAAMTGAVGVYLWGVIEEQIQELDGENEKYEKTIADLMKLKKQLGDAVSKVAEDVDDVREEADTILKHLAAFEDLRKSLSQTAGSEQTIDDLIHDLNETFADARRLERVNKRAALLAVYYDASFWRGGDRSEGLTRREYERMLQKLPEEFKEAAEELTDFETLAGADSIVDISEFQGFIEQLLDEVEDTNLVAVGSEL